MSYYVPPRSLKDLLAEQRKDLDVSGRNANVIIPTQSYLARLTPIRTGSAASADKRARPGTAAVRTNAAPTVQQQRAASSAATRSADSYRPSRLHALLSQTTSLLEGKCDAKSVLDGDERSLLVDLIAAGRKLLSAAASSASSDAFTDQATMTDAVVNSEPSATTTAALGVKPTIMARQVSDDPSIFDDDSESPAKRPPARMSSNVQKIASALAARTSSEGALDEGAGESCEGIMTSTPSAIFKHRPTSASSEDDGGSIGSKLKRNLGKLRLISAAPQVYRSIVDSKESMEQLYRFATECSSAKLGTESVLKFVESYIQQTCKANRCVVYTYVDEELRRGTYTARSHHNRSGSAIGPEEDTVVSGPVRKVAESGEASREDGLAILPIRAEKAVVGVALVLMPDEKTDYALIDNLLSIAGLFIRNNNSYIEARRQRKHAESMFNIARKLASDNLDQSVLVNSIMRTATELVDADRCTLYILNGNELVPFFDEGDAIAEIGGDQAIAKISAERKEIINIPDAHADPRFSTASDVATGTRTGAILCVPVEYEGALVAVTQLVRRYTADRGDTGARPFTAFEQGSFTAFSSFVGVSLRNCKVHNQLLHEKRKTEAVLSVVRQLSGVDIRNVNEVVGQVLQGAKQLLNADRATLFLIDKERDELYSTIADDTGGREIRFEVGKGIAGMVAKDSEALNIRDAYQDSRFNPAVDKATGYHTTSMLTEPIKFQDNVVAVTQLINKLEANGRVTHFTQEDQELFRAFSLFAGISLSNSHLLEFAVRAGQEAMELSATRTGGRRGAAAAKIATDEVTDAAVQRVLSIDLDHQITEKLDTPFFSLFDIRENYETAHDIAAAVVVEIFSRTGYLVTFGCSKETLCRFVLACRMKYRNVPYHNFYHAVDVCQTIYTYLYLGKVGDLLSALDCFVLLITALAHDLDHMGLNNSFHLKTDSPLGILSSASGNNSVLEVHHCNVAISILDDPQKNVFKGLETPKQTFAYRRMIDCILATDMARHKEMMSTFESICSNGYNRHDDDHSKSVMQMVIKAADISNVTKPFAISRKWGMSVTEEFYMQGDKEKAKGVAVLPMFDRDQHNELAKGQIGFINFVALPFFGGIVNQQFTGLAWTVENIQVNVKEWTSILESREQQTRRR